jgi:hypothetical protein
MGIMLINFILTLINGHVDNFNNYSIASPFKVADEQEVIFTIT